MMKVIIFKHVSSSQPFLSSLLLKDIRALDADEKFSSSKCTRLGAEAGALTDLTEELRMKDYVKLSKLSNLSFFSLLDSALCTRVSFSLCKCQGFLAHGSTGHCIHSL